LPAGSPSAAALAERVIYRELFPRGLTALDPLDQSTLGIRPSLSHLTAQQEVAGFIDFLRLPFEGGLRLSAGAEWLTPPQNPLEVHDIVKS
jgi:chromosome partitioning protein